MYIDSDHNTDAFAELRAALELYGKPPFELSPEQLERARGQAQRERAIESSILASPDAVGVIVSEQEVDRAVGEIRGRYPDAEAFHHALETNSLDESTLRDALRRQCRVDAVLERVLAASHGMDIGDTEIAIYYHSHFANFQQPERRETYHILISINDDFPENSRVRARERIEAIGERLKQKPKLFEDLAQRHSECPTAMRGGLIGQVRKGQLFPTLDTALFMMKAGQLSEVLESEVGFHLLYCKRIQPPMTISLKKATPHIRNILQERARENLRRTWIARLNPLQAA
jgi:nitrogen fixation protein NifM